ncbi:uncharacterized protein [Watersipora subatra]|uniref:uncharacterized protein n=1 Tax=Watersipora subatra TaxID=2589382 RepID=UPI00355B0715
MGHTTVLQSMLTSIPPDKVSVLVNRMNMNSRTPLEDAESEGKKESVELLKSWQQPVLAAHAAATDKKIAALEEADRHKTKELTKLKEELAESQLQILALRDVGNRKMSDMAAIMERLNRLDIYLRTPTDTDETGDQLHDPQG